MTTIATFDRIEEAQAFHTALISEGIPSKLSKGDAPLSPGTHEQFQISTSGEHAEQAIVILRLFREQQFDDIKEANRTKHNFSRYIKFWGIAVSTIFILVLIRTSGYSLDGVGYSLLAAGIIGSLLTGIVGGLDL